MVSRRLRSARSSEGHYLDSTYYPNSSRLVLVEGRGAIPQLAGMSVGSEAIRGGFWVAVRQAMLKIRVFVAEAPAEALRTQLARTYGMAYVLVRGERYDCGECDIGSVEPVPAD